MGISNWVDEENATVGVDDRGRITIPKSVRDRLGIRPGDELEVIIEEGTLRLHPEQTELVTVTSGKDEWGREAFPDSGEATFGGDPRTRDE